MARLPWRVTCVRVFGNLMGGKIQNEILLSDSVQPQRFGVGRTMARLLFGALILLLLPGVHGGKQGRKNTLKRPPAASHNPGVPALSGAPACAVRLATRCAWLRGEPGYAVRLATR